MINIWEVVANSLWILGLAILLAVWSYARYTAHASGLRIKVKLNTLKYALVLNVGLLLFLCGMVFTEERWFIKIVWILLTIGVIVESGMRIQQHKKDKAESNGQNESQVD